MDLPTFLVGFLGFICLVASQENCQCWEGWTPETDDQGTRCVGPKDQRFSCSEEKPPLCICKDKVTGEKEFLDLGETYCGDTRFERLQCEPKDEWEPYFERNPQFRLYNGIAELQPPKL